MSSTHETFDSTTAAGGSFNLSGGTIDDRDARRRGLVLAAGAVIWSAASYAYGFDPEVDSELRVTDLSSFAFQIGAMALVGLQLRTKATGTSAGARLMLRVEQVMLTLAMVWSVSHALLPSQRDSGWMSALDFFWPLSMLGMFIISVKVAFAGRWQGLARFWPLVAESWALVTLPSIGIFGETVGTVVGATHLLIGYAALGAIIAARPELTKRRD